VQVVDREQRRLLKGHVGGEPVEAVEERERALCESILCSGKLRGFEKRFHERRRPREQLRAKILSCGGQQRLEQLTDDSVRELALELAAAGGERSHLCRAGHRARLGEQARLADAGTSLDDGKAPAAAPCRVDHCPERRDLGFAL
jgi:hypothetical protein